ncbi:hypothetical protein [Citrobacter sp. 50677481]|uniref:hypothetical protein n=1 Tax=Citrobacter sp. 50677481 TaxID=1736699 RepID=UPI0007422F91|nr:hypothetical protein [Citrobacter sp. 50677481]KSY32919.1 hypothetical protein APU02_04410 [Citrobacter sp. 50677481]
MTLEQRVEALEFKVGFPEENGVRISFGENLRMSSTQRIGSNVSVKISKETLATIQYSEDLTPELTLEEYNQRAKEHAQNVLSKIIEATRKQAAENDKDYDKLRDRLLDNAVILALDSQS